MLLEPDTVFEVKHRSLLGRIGRIRTKKGYLETPTLFPVIDTKRQLVEIEKIRALGFRAVMTNAYLLLKRGVKVGDIHDYLRFDGIVATDSGAYQLLEFGGIRASQKEIIEFQEQIGVDIAVILDTPTGQTQDKEWARRTVDTTLRNAQEAIELRRREDVLWVGPIQGGEYTDLVEYCSKEMAKLPFHLHGLGSPTEFLEGYRYRTILEMIASAKRNIPPSRPLHLFGAGHPAVLPFFVALGVDLFDSASYALFAKDGRYLTSQRTYRLETLVELPCRCGVCAKYTAKELHDAEASLREKLLAEHNLSVIAEEISRIRLAIYQGTLWDLLQARMHSHPQIFEAFRWFLKRAKSIARYTPITSPTASGLFVFSPTRPEILLFKRRLKRFVEELKPEKIVVLSSQSQLAKAKKYLGDNKTLVVVLHSSLGAVPVELLDTYPVYQIESVDRRPKIEGALGVIVSQRSATIVVFDKQTYRGLRRRFGERIVLEDSHDVA